MSDDEYETMSNTSMKVTNTIMRWVHIAKCLGGRGVCQAETGSAEERAERAAEGLHQPVEG